MDHLKQSVFAGGPSSRSGRAIQRLSEPAQLLVASTGIISLHLVFGDEMFSFVGRLLAGVLAVAAYYSILQVARRKQRNELPFRELYVVLFYVFFGLPIFWEDSLSLLVGVYVPSSRALDLALWAAVLSLGVFYLCYPLGQKLGRRLRPLVKVLLPKTLPSGTSGSFTLWVLVPLVIIITYNLLLTAVKVSIDIQRVILFMGSAPLLLATCLHLAEITNSRQFRIAAVIVFVTSLAIGLLTGMLELFLLPVALVSLYRWLVFKKTRFVWMLVGLLLFIILNPAKLDYRADMRSLSETKKEVTLSDRLEAWQEAITSKWSVADNVEENLDNSRSRVADLLPVAQVIEYVPERVPYAEGGPWMAVPYSLVPRLLWPNKPDLTQMTNSAYAVSFDRLSPEQVLVTTVNVPQLADGYWNLGWFGVIIVAMAAGLSMGFKASAFETSGWATCVIGLVFFISVRPQGDLSSLVTGSLQTYIGAVVFLRLLVIGESVLQTLGWRASALQPRLR